MDYVFDACAVIALLNDEDGADTVAGLINQAEIGVDRIFMNGVQVLEVYYDRIYIKSLDYAETVLESLYNSPIIILHEISRDIIQEAGRFKTSFSMSLGDTFAAATARKFTATLVTRDKEMKAPEEAGEFSVLWLK
jgi:predicted nucleic acid-binding protein